MCYCLQSQEVPLHTYCSSNYVILSGIYQKCKELQKLNFLILEHCFSCHHHIYQSMYLISHYVQNQVHVD